MTVNTHPVQQHRPVLLNEAVQAVVLHPAACIVDATFGRGGHTRAILERLGPDGCVVAFDRDPEAIAVARAVGDPRLQVVHAPFSAMHQELIRLGKDRVDAVLMDLGVSSPQLDEAQRGFSFRFDGPLDMRMDPGDGSPTAAQWLAQATVEELTEVIRTYGEERFAFQIAQAIAARTAQARAGSAEALGTTRQLADLVGAVVRRRQARPERGLDPATRTFQAIRIHINRELDELPAALIAATRLLREGGHLAVISFHSLEDRIVKQTLRGDALGVAGRPSDRRLRHLPLAADQPEQLWPLRPVARLTPSEAEVALNPRARSSILRVARRTAGDVGLMVHGRSSVSAPASRVPASRTRSAHGVLQELP